MIRKRDNYNCQRCGKSQEFELADFGCVLAIHHYDNDHYNDAPENMVTLCSYCHRIITMSIYRMLIKKSKRSRDQEDLEIMFAAAEGQRRARI